MRGSHHREQVDEDITRCPVPAKVEAMTNAIKEARRDRDSIGGVVSCVCRGELVFTWVLHCALRSVQCQEPFLDNRVGGDQVSQCGSSMVHHAQSEIHGSLPLYGIGQAARLDGASPALTNWKESWPMR